MQGVRSEKAIPSFLKNNALNKKKFPESLSYKNGQMSSSQQNGRLELSIESFEIVEKLGEGKFGCVFLAV